MKTFESKLLWQGKLLDGVVAFTLIAPTVIKYEFKAWDAEIDGEYEVDTLTPDTIVQKLIAAVSENYLNGTVELRKSLNLTLH